MAFASLSVVRAQDHAAFDRTVRPVLAGNCFGCHNTARATSGLDLQSLSATSDIRQNREQWEGVLQKLLSGEMPPRGVPPRFWTGASGNGSVASGRHIVYDQPTPMTNLYLTMLDQMGVNTNHLGDSTGTIEHLSI